MSSSARHLLILLGCLPIVVLGQQPQIGGPVSGAVSTGRYRNLFIEAGISGKDVTQKLDAAFQQLFHGNPDTEAIYYESGRNANGKLAYVTDVAHHDVRSEGMSYGMMIAVQMDKKEEFDAIWNWSKTYMYRDEPGHPARGYFSWSMKPISISKKATSQSNITGGATRCRSPSSPARSITSPRCTTATTSCSAAGFGGCAPRI